MRVYSDSFFAMNTRFVMVIPGIPESPGAELSSHIRMIVMQPEHVYSRFLPGAELRSINTEAHRKEISVSGPMAQVLDLCDTYNLQTGGLFDPGFAPIYDQLRSKESSSAIHLKELHDQCGWRWVNWNKKSQTIHFLNDTIKLDFGAVAKGIALKEVVVHLKNNGIENAFLSFGESSIAGVGTHPYGDGWPVGVDETLGNPKQKPVFLLKDAYLSVSGLQSKACNVLEAHIYHPLKGQLVSVSDEMMVKSNCPVEAEVLSTAVYLANENERKYLMNHFPDISWHYRARTGGPVTNA